MLTYPPYWAALVTVTIPSMGHRSQVGTCAIQGDEVDCLKAAISDGLKKCLTLFGVGLHLYEEDGDNGSQASRRPPSGPTPRAAAKSPARKVPSTRRRNASGAPEPVAPAPEPLTEAQQRAIFAISQQAGFTPGAFMSWGRHLCQLKAERPLMRREG